MSSTVLVINSGSSSIKYQLFDPATEEPMAVGIVQRIGQGKGSLEHETGGEEFKITEKFENHKKAVRAVVECFNEHGPSLEGVVAVGHRTVHGGAEFRSSVRINDEVIATLRELYALAPLHNPPSVAGIEGAMKVLPDVPHVAVFDTTFFADMPPHAYTYAIDAEVTKRFGIRRFGFHGTSHKYVSGAAAEFLGRPRGELKVIVAHLGNGASMSAVDGGVAVDTSMGLTPLEGLVMGTRSGDVDPGLHRFLSGKGMSADEIDEMLNKRSGMGGLTGYTDMRDIDDQIAAGNEQADLALDIYVHRLLHYIGSYMAVLGGLDALVFTAGVGENSTSVRGRTIKRLEGLGFQLDPAANEVRSKEPREISTPESKVRVLVIPTNEELAMARETMRVLGLNH